MVPLALINKGSYSVLSMALPSAAGKALEHGTLAWLKSLELDQALSFVIGGKFGLIERLDLSYSLIRNQISQHCSRI
jgi:hypothetical protein